jgi:lysine-specific demethylase 3
MYNALASSEKEGTKGSTRLHMDMADAVNIMTYASITPTGGEGYAAWDIYKPEDAETIRKFLRDRFTTPQQQDPIHSQQYYLDTTLRRQLYEKTGVASHRIYQRAGEAVFIPAGCAHQVPTSTH